jgi:D-3-phosphoglycerate dehydrogenase
MVSFAELTRPVIEGMEQCRVVVRCGMGVNNVDIAAASKKNIPVANVRQYCLEEVSDHAITLALCLLRKVAYMDRLVRSGCWEASRARPIRRIRGQVFALYGLGSIAGYVARKAAALGFRVVAYDPFLPESVFAELQVRRIDTEEALFRCADVLSLHLPLTPDTAKIVTLDKLRGMKPSAVLINTARGGLVDEAGLVFALQSGVLAGAGLDVLADEYPSMDNPLFQMENTLVTPHYAYYSEDSDVDLRNLACDQVIGALKTGLPRFCVNKKDLDLEKLGVKESTCRPG